MNVWFRHPSDDGLAELARGALSNGPRHRMINHLRGCARCAERHERLVHLERTLAGGRPNEPIPAELAALREANRAAVMASARAGAASAPARDARWSARGLLRPALSLAFVGVVGLVLLRQQLAVTPSDGAPAERSEFTARGQATPGTEAVMRVFCARPGEAPFELGDGHPCPPGATLAFAVRFAEPPDALELEIRGGSNDARFSLSLKLEADRETVLPETALLEGTGEREVVLTAGPRVLRQTVKVEAGP